jgi:hypothetical protein
LIQAVIAFVCAVDPSAFRVPFGHEELPVGAPDDASVAAAVVIVSVDALLAVSVEVLLEPAPEADELPPELEFPLLPQADSTTVPAIARAAALVARRPPWLSFTDQSP